MNILSRATENVRLFRLRLNSFVNELTGLNTWKDRNTQYNFRPRERLTIESIIAMYHDSPIARKMVNCIVDDALRKNIEIDHEISDEILNELNRLKLFSLLKRACKSAREKGGALVFYHVNDGNLTEFAVNHKRIKEVKVGFILSKESYEPMTADKDGKPIDWFEGAEIEFYKIKFSNSQIIFY